MAEGITRTGSWISKAYFVSLMLLAASIPLSKFTTSVCQFMILGCWLLYDIKILHEIKGKESNRNHIFLFAAKILLTILLSMVRKFKLFFRNKVAMVLFSLLLLHVFGLLYTSDYEYALKDLRTKLPLLLLPLFFSTGPPVSTKTLRWILFGFIAAIFGGTIYRIYLYLHLPFADTRELSAHISHIRFSLNTVLAIFILFYYGFFREQGQKHLKLIAIFLITWFITFMIFMGYLTGLSILTILSVVVLIYFSFRGSSMKVRLLGSIGGILLILVPVIYTLKVVEDYRHTKPVSFSELEHRTINGNSYYHDTINFRIENGRYTGLFICDKELRREWKKRSSRVIDSLDDKQQVLRFTLIRYLSSLNLHKDSLGMSRLSAQDIRRIEAGITQADEHPQFSPYTQIDHFMTSWDNYWRHGNPNSSSLIQRIEYWRTSLALIRMHPLFGVGTGDVPEAFKKYYEQNHSKLDAQYRLRSHNQFLSITVAFGLIGFFWFLFVLIYPLLYHRNFKNYLYLVFWMIFIISLLTEDTIETQEGVTFFAYFSSLYLLAWKKDPDKPESSTL